MITTVIWLHLYQISSISIYNAHMWKLKISYLLLKESNLVTMLYFVILSLIMIVCVDSEECPKKVTELKSTERKLRNELVHLQNVFLERLSRTDSYSK